MSTLHPIEVLSGRFGLSFCSDGTQAESLAPRMRLSRLDVAFRVLFIH